MPLHNDALFVPFGLPGAGKSYAARLFENFGFFYHDGDNDLPERMKIAIANASPVDDGMRDEFFQQIISTTAQLKQSHPRLVVAQTFIKEKYRLLFLEAFPHAHFVLVQAEDTIRERRLERRTNQPLQPDYARRMALNFDPPHIPYTVIVNNRDGKDHLLEQIAALVE